MNTFIVSAFCALVFIFSISDKTGVKNVNLYASSSEMASLANDLSSDDSLIDNTNRTALQFKADISSGLIGITKSEPVDDPADNVFHITLPFKPSYNVAVYLQYDLFGFNSYYSVGRSVNNAQALGGQFVSTNKQWKRQKERIPVGVLKKGDNIVRFSLGKNFEYYCRVKNVSLIVETDETAAPSLWINNVVHDTAKRVSHVRGIVDNPKQLAVTLFCDGLKVPLIDDEFELTVANDKLSTASFKAVFSDGHVVSRKPNWQNLAVMQQVYSSLERGVREENVFVPGHLMVMPMTPTVSAGIKLLPHALKKQTAISITALRDIDLPALNPDMVNVTKGAAGYRFLPHGANFDLKAQIILPFDTLLIPEGYSSADVRTYFFDDAERQWIELPLDTIIGDNNVVISATTHFTDMINGIIKVPESPQTQGYTPTSIKDFKAADPSLNIGFINPPVANNTGNAMLSFPFKMPKGRHSLQPDIAIRYNNEGGNSWLGLGWNLAISSIGIDTRWGAPRYDDSLETETYTLNGEQLAPLAHRDSFQSRTGGPNGKRFHLRVEGSFHKIIRRGTNPKNYWWEVINKNGTRNFYGGVPGQEVINTAVLKDGNGNIAYWALVETRDRNDNFIHYEYDSVSDPGIAGGIVPGRQIYVSRIQYTGHGTVRGAFSIRFIRDRELNEPRRNDVEINGILGFKLVTADLLRKVEVRFNSQLIRSYELKYQEGAFYKTLLKSVSELDNDGTVFYSHEFNYYDDVNSQAGYDPFGIEESWFPGYDNIKGDLQNIIPGFTAESSILNSTKSHSSFKSKATTQGRWDGNISKTNTSGKSHGSATGETEGITTLLDINGDGLPDKVFKKSGQLFYRPNLGSTTRQFGDVHSLAGVNNYNRSNSITITKGSEVNGSTRFKGKETSNTINTTFDYFTDFNGDGLIDISSDGHVFFNRLNSNGHPEFLLGSTSTPSPIVVNNYINPVFLAPDTALQAKQERDYPLQDAIRFWEAPFDGNVRIVAPVQLIDVASPGIVNRKTDGVLATIQFKRSELWRQRIFAGDFTSKNFVLDSLNVQKGDRIYFRLSSVYNGENDVVKWDPFIGYNSSVAPSINADNRLSNEYQASSDFILHNPYPLSIHKDGQITIDGNFTKGLTSDTVHVIITKQKNNTVTTLLHQIYTPNSVVANQAVNIATMSVSEGDTINFILRSDSHIDISKVSWKPHYYYVSFTDSTPPINLDGRPSVEGYPVPDSKNYNDWIIKTFPLQSTLQDNVLITPLISAAPAATGSVTFTVKANNTILGKIKFQLVNGVLSGNVNSLAITRKPGEQLFCEYHIIERTLALAVHSAKFIVGSTTGSNNDTLQAGMFTNPAQDFLGALFRGWGAFSFRGDARASLLDESKLDLGTYTNFFIDLNTYTDSSFFNQIGDASLAEFIPQYPDGERNSWVGFDTSVYVASNIMGSARLWLYDVSIDSLMIGASLTAANKISETSSTSYSLGAKENETTSFTTTVNKLDMMDVNGDRYPDVLHKNDIQFTFPTGGLEKGARTFNLGLSHFEGNSEGKSLGGTYPVARAKNTSAFKALNVSANAAATIGVSSSTSNTNNDDSAVTFWIDVNADGLPDKVKADGKIALNLGYEFAAFEDWGTPGIEHNKGSQNGSGTSYGYNKYFSSFQGGYSLLKGDDDCLEVFEDVNGDGLPDKLSMNPDLGVRLNTGSGFGPAIKWEGLIRKSSSVGESQNKATTTVSFYQVIGPVSIDVYKRCSNKSSGSSKGISRETDMLLDVDGDGIKDLIKSPSDSNLIVRKSRIAKTNMLRSVKRPMGSSFTIDYERLGNTYEMPQSKWVLKRVEMFDGVPGDGADTLRTTFKYSNGFYERHEREFFGFRQVETNELNTADNNSVYRTTVEVYLNDNYYTNGLRKQQWLQDGAGNKFNQTNYLYNIKPVLSEVFFPALIQTENLFYEGAANPGASTMIRFEYHDSTGNVEKIVDMGDGTQQDMSTTIIEYHDIDDRYIKDIPKSITVNTAEGIRRRYRETELTADGNNISEIKQYLKQDSFARYSMEYFSNGNLSRLIRPANYKGERMWYRYEYDTSVRTYVTKVTDTFGYSSSSSYDFWFGEIIETVSMNNERIRYGYDNRGRLTSVIGPYEIAGGGDSTLIFKYYPMAKVPFAETLHYDPEYKNYIRTVTFMDGLMRLLQTKKQASIFKGKGQNDDLRMIVSGRTVYDAFSRPVNTFFPLTDATGATDTVFTTAFGRLMAQSTHDVADRVTNMRLADGAVTLTAYSTVNGFLRESVQDPLKNTIEILTDVKGRKRAVNNMSGPNGTITTTFHYNALNELLRTVDTKGNAIVYTYDNLGRKKSYNHPDGGLTTYDYDLASNLIAKITPQIRHEIPNGGAIKYLYECERLIGVDYPRQYQNRVTYTYGKAGTGGRAGRLILQQDASGGTEFFYGKLGEVVKTIRTVMVNQVFYTTYVSEQEYDTWNRLKKMVYPDGEVVNYYYNRGGGLHSIDGTKLGNTYRYVDQVGYDEFEQRVYLRYGNGTENNYQYDSLRRRLHILQASTSSGRRILNNKYDYDPVGNITFLENNVQGAQGLLGGFSSHTYKYDALYRLDTAYGKYTSVNRTDTYRLEMSYNDLYNIESKNVRHSNPLRNDSLVYRYKNSAPHQLDNVAGERYRYDLNGNLLGTTKRQHFWDEENRLMAIIDSGILSRYTYDAGGERVIKSSGGIQGTWINGAPAGLINHDSNYTTYVSPYLVCRRTSFTKHIYIESQRVATKIGIGRFTNISFPQAALTAGGIDYLKRAANLQKQRYDYYATLGISPGPPTDKYFYAHPYNSGIAAPILVDSTVSCIPPGWPGNPTPPGIPPAAVPIPSNDSVKAGYGFVATGHFYEQNQYFYHPDHLGSSSYITDVFGEVSQHQEYIPFGETFVEEHRSGYKSPYLFNAKERDGETGLYYYGARYYDPKTSMWITVDAKTEKYPGVSPYNYCLNNPVVLTDPSGFEPEESVAANVVNWINNVFKGVGLAREQEFQIEPARGTTLTGIRYSNFGRIKNGQRVGEAVIRVDIDRKGTPHFNINPKASGWDDPHTLIPGGQITAKTLGFLGKTVDQFGKLAKPVSFVTDAGRVLDAIRSDGGRFDDNSIITTFTIGGEWLGATVGARAGVWFGFGLGGVVGTPFGPFGATVGAVSGGLAGAYFGGVFGTRVGGQVGTQLGIWIVNQKHANQ